MTTEDRSRTALSAEACRDEAVLKRFIQANISVNAWPIQSKPLRTRILDEGLDLEAAGRFSMPIEAMERLMVRLYHRSRRVERTLRIDNAFHTSLHNFEVLLRLLLLEWPEDQALPDEIRHAPMRIYASLEAVLPVLLEVLEALLRHGVPASILARDLLAALGHDFGHSGGTDRVDRRGMPGPLTHEEAAEKHVAKLGLEFGYPPALILESMAGIRATTFYSRPGRERIHATNDFERKLTLADVMGCVLPPAEWLTHVGVPVLKEKLPGWKRRRVEISRELVRLEEQMASLPKDDPRWVEKDEAYTRLLAERAHILGDIEEWFKSERSFFLFLESHKLTPVAGARELWGGVLKEKIALMERVLAKREALRPLVERGFGFLEEYAHALANVESLEAWLRQEDVDPHLKDLLSAFVAPPRSL